MNTLLLISLQRLMNWKSRTFKNCLLLRWKIRWTGFKYLEHSWGIYDFSLNRPFLINFYDLTFGCSQSPVSMLSLTMQVPQMSTASQGMMVPLLGMTMTSPGTKSVDRASSVSVQQKQKTKRERRNKTSLSQQITYYPCFLAQECWLIVTLATVPGSLMQAIQTCSSAIITNILRCTAKAYSSLWAVPFLPL